MTVRRDEPTRDDIHQLKRVACLALQRWTTEGLDVQS